MTETKKNLPTGSNCRSKVGVVDASKPPVESFSLQVRLSELAHLAEFIDEPPYARGLCWEKEAEMRLCQSVRLGINTGLIRLVASESAPGRYWLQDGKQRITCLLDHFQEFSEEERFSSVIDVCITAPTDMQEQADFFCTINY